jgi:hypothetical protein
MKIIVAHSMPDLDAITSIWLIKSFLPGWEDANVNFVPAGTRMEGANPGPEISNAIENVKGNEVIHVDTGLGPLDHHQTMSHDVCAASLTWDYVRENGQLSKVEGESEKVQDREQAISRMVNIVVDDDHFKQVFYPDPNADRYDFMLSEILDGLKLQKPDSDQFYVDFVSTCLDAIFHHFENKIWAEKEIKEKGVEFESVWGRALGFDSINDEVIRIGQKMGYVVIVRKDPRKGYVRIKASPAAEVDLTNTYEKLKKIDPDATWYLHVGKRMLLNGSTKNPKTKPTNLSLDAIIAVLKKV